MRVHINQEDRLLIVLTGMEDAFGDGLPEIEISEADYQEYQEAFERIMAWQHKYQKLYLKAAGVRHWNQD